MSRPEPNGDSETTSTESPSHAGTPARTDPGKPLTVVLPEDLLKRLRVLAVVRDRSVSDIVTEHLEALVRRDLKKALAKLEP